MVCLCRGTTLRSKSNLNAFKNLNWCIVQSVWNVQLRVFRLVFGVCAICHGYIVNVRHVFQVVAASLPMTLVNLLSSLMFSNFENKPVTPCFVQSCPQLVFTLLYAYVT